jgi:hypothetical protein
MISSKNEIRLLAVVLLLGTIISLTGQATPGPFDRKAIMFPDHKKKE